MKKILLIDGEYDLPLAKKLPVDALGKRIEIGDLVAYAAHDCDAAALGAGRVVDFKTNQYGTVRIMIERVINTSRYRTYQKLLPQHRKIVGCEFPERMAVIQKGVR